MRRLTYKNSAGEKIVFYLSPLLIESLEGIAEVDVNIQGQKPMNQDGDQYLGSTLEPRFIDMEGTITKTNLLEIKKYRQLIIRVCNPKLGLGEITLELDGDKKKIFGVLDGVPSFPERRRDPFQRFTITWKCPNPFFRELDESREDVSTEVGNFIFPLHIPKEGLELSIRTISFITNIYNPGDAETPIRVHLRAIGTVVNPIIENLDTGEFIRVNRTLSKGDTLEINTEFGNKRVEIIKEDGSRENVFHYIDYKSKFFSINAGDTTIKYDAEVGNNNLDVLIYYTPKYLGV